jgi:hypothetical protein
VDVNAAADDVGVVHAFSSISIFSLPFKFFFFFFLRGTVNAGESTS